MVAKAQTYLGSVASDHGETRLRAAQTDEGAECPFHRCQNVMSWARRTHPVSS